MQETEWLIIFLIFISSLLIGLRNYYQKEYYYFVRSPFSFKIFNEYVYELNQRAGIFTYVMYFIALTLSVTLVYFLIGYLNLSFIIQSSVLSLVYLFFSALVVQITKNLGLRLIQMVFKFSDLINIHILIILIFNSISGLIIFPFLLMIVYLDTNLIDFSLIALIIVISVLFLMRIIYLSKILFRSGFSILGILLYLCALEIAPLLVLLNVVKLLVN